MSEHGTGVEGAAPSGEEQFTVGNEVDLAEAWIRKLETGEAETWMIVCALRVHLTKLRQAERYAPRAALEDALIDASNARDHWKEQGNKTATDFWQGVVDWLRERKEITDEQ